MKPSLTILALFAFLSAANAEEDGFNEILKPAFAQNCVKCHGENGKVKGKVDLLALNSSKDLEANEKLLGKLIEALEFEDMPPEDEPPLDPKLRKQMIGELNTVLRSAITSKKAFAHTPIRRMNRFQYNNAVEDLFQLKVTVFPLPERMLREYGNYFQPAKGEMPYKVKVGSRPLGKSQLIEPRLVGVDPFPQDLRAEHGFDNQGNHLSLSPLLMESFLKLSKSVLESRNFDQRTCGIWNNFFAEPKGETEVSEVVRERLQGFLGTAFRKPVSNELLKRYAAHAMARIQSGDSFTEAMKSVASATLASPRFLYLYDEATSNDSSKSQDDYELASRLSFFLWGSIPDDELLAEAEDGKLSNPKNLEKQVERMMNDRRLKRFCDSFPSQWLQLDRIISSVPDVNKYEDFYYAPPNYRTSMDMMLEPLLLFETILVEDRPILELIDSNYTYRSKRLQSWYGEETDGRLGGPATIEFNRMPVSDRRHGGVITTAAVMTMTSGPKESKPITRGAWLAGAIFNDPPEPPPADVPPLKKEEEAKNLTVRERFKVHRENATCAGCHAKLDPLGFALENYDAVGRWRDQYENGRKVDMKGILFRKHNFSDLIEFKDAILAEKKRFTRALAGHLLAFALGREVSASDFPAIERIVKETAAADYSMKKMIHLVTQSAPFVAPSNPERKKSLEN
jgi:mono/diheme cytochrome c family protein